MEGKGTSLLNDKPTKIDSDFYGLSGGGLWHLTFKSVYDKNEISIDYRLVGILTEFKKGKYFCLIASKIHLFLDAFTNIEHLNFKSKIHL